MISILIVWVGTERKSKYKRKVKKNCEEKKTLNLLIVDDDVMNSVLTKTFCKIQIKLTMQ